jgi:hypothetical protein
MSFYTMYALCAVITCCYVAVDLSENTNDYSRYRARDKLLAILVLGLFWPVLFIGILVGFIFSFLKSLIGGVK